MGEAAGSVDPVDRSARMFALGAGRRERSSAGRRPRAVLVRLTVEEHDELARQAAARGVSVPRHLVECAAAVDATGSAARRTATDRREEMATLLGVRRLLANVANNVNQVARAANAGGLPMLQGEATAAFRAAKRASDRIFDAVDGMAPRR